MRLTCMLKMRPGDSGICALSTWPSSNHLAGLDQLHGVQHALRFHVIAGAALVGRAPFRGAARTVGRRRPRWCLGRGGGADDKRGKQSNRQCMRPHGDPPFTTQPFTTHKLKFARHCLGARLFLALFLARPLLPHGRERDQSEILRSRVRVRLDKARNDLKHLLRRRRARMTELEIVRQHTAHEREGRHDAGAAAAGNILRIRRKPSLRSAAAWLWRF